MKREVTNVIRYLMDEWLPPAIRDSKWFMYPAFYYWYQGEYISEIMEFQKTAYKMTPEEFAQFYAKVKNRAYERPTDMNQASIELIVSKLSPDASTLLDVGCGRGYFLKVLSEKTNLSLTGCDMRYALPKELNAKFVEGYAETLPFADDSFDIVTCTHTIEHIINLDKVISELKRVAKKQLIIVTPRQKHYFYTLDMHLNFFPFEEKLTHAIGLKDYTIYDVEGDWVYFGNL